LEKGKKAYSGFFSHLFLKKTRIAPETQKNLCWNLPRKEEELFTGSFCRFPIVPNTLMKNQGVI